jgi:hypothetical protein
MLDPFQFLLVAVSGWINQRQQAVIEYLREENRVDRSSSGDSDCASMMTSCGLAVCVASLK